MANLTRHGIGLLLAVLTIAPAFAAPIPATSSSLLVSEKPGIFRSPKGFKINAANTDWILSEPPTDLPSVVTLYRSPLFHDGVQAVLTVRVDELDQKTDLKTYVKHWMKDYPILGFSVIKAKPMKVNTEIAYVLDLEESTSDRRIRQLVFLRDQTAVILTCRDRKGSFEKTLKDCNQIFRSFEWGSSPPSSRIGV